jgi:hypothetical protein
MDLSSFIRRVDRSKRRRDDAELRRQAPIKAARELYGELEFLHLLYIERRRSERSSRPLCLVLVEEIAPLNAATRPSALPQIVDQVHRAIRETDIMGWYSHNSTLAVMFSDFTSTDDSVVRVLGTKVSNAVSVALPATIAANIRLTVHLFPDETRC